MSDEIDWIPVLAWSACVSFQVGMAIRDGLKSALKLWQKRVRSKDCDHCRLIKGETCNGWLLVVPSNLYRQMGTRRVYFTRSQLWRKAAGEDRPSMIYGCNLEIRRCAAENRSVLQYRRFSLISPKVRATLFKIVHNNDQWWPQGFQYFGHRSVAGAFQQFIGDTPTGTHRIVIGDSFTRRQPRWFDIQAPMETAMLLHVYYENVPRDRLMVLFQDRLPKHQVDIDVDEDENEEWQFEFHLAAYETERPTGEGQQTPSPAVSWETISIPSGVRNLASGYILHEAVLMVLYDNTNWEAVENHLCVTFDNEKHWRVETYPEWLDSMQTTPVGARVMDAVNSLNKLRNVGRDSRSISLLKDLNLLIARINDGVAFCGSSPVGLLRRWYKPPPLWFLTAESLLRANPNLRRDQLKEAIGFDVFDDVPDEKGEEDAPIIYW